MPVSPLPQAPYRQDRRVFPTPRIGDVLFSEVRDCNRILIPEYGTPHPDTNKWPNHKLVYVRPVDIERDGLFEFFYAAERENQDEYNFEFGSVQIGGLLVDNVTRTYVTPRSEFDPSAPEATVGATMPDVPEGKFDGEWILYDVDQKRIGDQELDSLFVVVQHLYIKPTQGIGSTYGEIVTTDELITAVVDEGTDIDAGIDIISSQVTPLGNGKAVKVTKAVRDGWPDPVSISSGSPPEGLPPQLLRDNLARTTITRKVADIPESFALEGDVVGLNYTRETPDRVEEEVTTMSFDVYGGFLEESVNRTAYLITNTSSVASDTGDLPAVGDGSYNLIYRAGELTIYRNTTVTTEGVAGPKGTDTLAQAWGAIIEQTNYTLEPEVVAGGSSRLIFKDSMTQVYESTSVSVTVSGTTKEVDNQLWGKLTWNGSYATDISGTRSRQVWSNGSINVYLNESATFEIDEEEFLSGRKTTPILVVEEYTSYSLTPIEAGQNISARIVYNVDGQRIYENTRSVVDTTGDTRTYAAVINFAVPSVFLGLDITTFERRDGGEETYFSANVREGFSGAVPCTVTEYFTKTPEPPEGLLTFKPEPISFVTPFGGLRVPPTLHGEFTYTFTTGTVDPIYKFIDQTVTIPATDPVDYLGQTIVANYDVTPYEDGYIVREYTIEL